MWPPCTLVCFSKLPPLTGHRPPGQNEPSLCLAASGTPEKVIARSEGEHFKLSVCREFLHYFVKLHPSHVPPPSPGPVKSSVRLQE